MSFDSLTDNSDTEFEFSSGSVCPSVESFNIFPAEPTAFPQTIQPAFYLQFIHVECVPVPFYSPKLCYPSDFFISYPTEAVQSSQRRLIKWSLPPPVNMQAVAPLPGWNPMPYGLETFWQSAFAWFFRPYLNTYGHLWTLEPTELRPLSCPTWHTTTYLAKVRFICQCKRGWTSMKGRVVFWFRVRHEGDQVFHEAIFKLFGQQCKLCNDSESSYESPFLTPLWYPEEIENAISFLSSQIALTLYGASPEDCPPINRIRFSQSRSSSAVHHDTTRCQVCQDGLSVCTSKYFSP